MSEFSIRNHVQYNEHMKDYVTKEKCRELISKYSERLVTLEKQNAKLEKIKAKCMPKQSKCPPGQLDKHPDYIALKKQCPTAFGRLDLLRKQCGKPKCPTCPTCPECPSVASPKCRNCPPCKKCAGKNTPIMNHPDYPALLESHRKELTVAMSKVEGEFKRKTRTDIRYHQDYQYFKSYYESIIQSLKSGKCPDCPKCAARKGRKGRKDKTPDYIPRLATAPPIASSIRMPNVNPGPDAEESN
jgi:hypothetical protein